MINDFLCIEDINSILYSNQHLWWHRVDVDIPDYHYNLTDAKIDFCTINREVIDSETFYFKVKVDNSYWDGKVYIKTADDTYIPPSDISDEDFLSFEFTSPTASVQIFLHMDLHSWIKTTDDFNTYFMPVRYALINLTPLDIQNSHNTRIIDLDLEILSIDGDSSWEYFIEDVNDQSRTAGGYPVDDHVIASLVLDEVLTELTFKVGRVLDPGQYYYIDTHLLKINPKPYFNQDKLINGNVNSINCYFEDLKNADMDDFHIHSDYPVVFEYNSTGDYLTLNLDLTSKKDSKNVKLEIVYDGDSLHNSFDEDFVFKTDYEKITNDNEFRSFIEAGGGTAILDADQIHVTTSGLLISNDLNLIKAEDRETCELSFKDVIIDEDVTFKADQISLIFNPGANDSSLIQKRGSTVELQNCKIIRTGSDNHFSAGFKCDIDITSLDNPSDFTTTLINCDFTLFNAQISIIHGGDLMIDNCVFSKTIDQDTGKDYPLFLYQTEGEATIINSYFDVKTLDTVELADIMFASCLFVCGENAQLNGFNHSDLQNNNFNSFLTNPVNNRTRINVKYYYDLIDDYIRINGDGFCHAVSGVDYVFKSNVNIQRVVGE